MPEKKTQQAKPQLKTTQPDRNQNTLPFNAQLKANLLKTRDDVQQALVDILTPAMNLCLSSGRLARLRMSDSGALYNTDCNQIEGFTCLLWGLGPLFTDPANITRYPDWWRYVTDSLTHTVDPSDPDSSEINSADCPLSDYSRVKKQQSSDPMFITAQKRSVFYRSGNLATGLVAAQGFEVELTHPEPNTNLRYPRTVLPVQTRVVEPSRYVFVSLYLGDAEADSSETILIPSVTLSDNELKLSLPGSAETTTTVTLREFNFSR